MMSKFGIYVQEIEYSSLFKRTFTPKRFFWCDVNTDRPRKINFHVKTLRDYEANDFR